MRREHRDEPLEVAAEQRLAAGEPHLLDAERDERARDALDLLEREQLVAPEELDSRGRRPPSACSRRSGSCSGR